MERYLVAIAFALSLLMASCKDEQRPEASRPPPSLSELQKENQNLKNKISKMEKNESELKAQLRTTQYWLIGVGAIIGAVIAGVVGIILLGKRGASSSINHDQTKCPRCGWTVNPAEGVCGNPDCRTRLR